MWSSKHGAEFGIDIDDAEYFEAIQAPNVFDARRMLAEDNPGINFSCFFCCPPSSFKKKLI